MIVLVTGKRFLTTVCESLRVQITGLFTLEAALFAGNMFLTTTCESSGRLLFYIYSCS